MVLTVTLLGVCATVALTEIPAETRADGDAADTSPENQ